MSKSNRSCWMRAIVGFSGVTLGLMAAAAQAAGPSTEAARVETYKAADGASYFALSLPAVAATASEANDIVVLFDTSAAQVGEYREKSLETLSAMLQKLGDRDRVQLLAVDINAIPLTTAFVAPRGPEMTAALTKLRGRVPLGATDMGIALTKAIDSFKADRASAAKSLVYIGDGASRANAMADEYESIVDQLVENRVAVSSFAIGRAIDATLLASLANQTGGMLIVNSDPLTDRDPPSLNSREVGHRLAQFATSPVVWPTTLALPKEVADVYPKHVPPLRTDRDTVLVGKGTPSASFDLKLEGQSQGKPVSIGWTATSTKSNPENAYFVQVYDAARGDGGYRLPTVGTDGLHEARRLVNLGAQGLARLGSQAVATGNVQQAKLLVGEALRRDPTNQRAIMIKDQLDGLGTRVIPVAQVEPLPQGASAPTPPAPDTLRIVNPPPAGPPTPDEQGAQFLTDFNRRQAVLSGRIIADVNQALQEARGRVSIDPDRVIQDLALKRESVMRAAELPGETRAQLRKQIEDVLSLAQTRKRELEANNVAAQQRVAQAVANQRIQEGLVRNELKVKQLLERMNALMSEGVTEDNEDRFVEAERAAAEAVHSDPDNAVTASAAINARFQTVTFQNARFRDQEQRNFLSTMHLVDISSIPFPDEPPIIYPSADRWRQLTKDRERYRSVDLKNPGSAEAKILRALDEPTEMDFISTQLKDVVDALKIRHGIEIQLDLKNLADAGITPETEITRTLKGISLKSALRLMLGEKEMNFIIDHEVLLITTDAKAKEKTVTKVYPVADLVLPIAINPSVNPFQTGGGLGGQNSVNSGQNGGMNGGGFGGGFGGGGGGGGGFGAGGGGQFAVADPIDASAKSAATVSVKAESKPAAELKLSGRVEVSPAVVAPVQQIRTEEKLSPVARIKVEGADRDRAWDKYFADLPTPDKDRSLSVGRQRDHAVRETARQLTSERKFADVAAMLRAALRNGYGQPWMYEALALAMQADSQPREEIERALMSAVQFANTTNDLMFVAAYLSRNGFDSRALSLYRQASQLDPSRHEPYMHGIEVALRLNDVKGIQWACVGVLGQAWPNDKMSVVQVAHRAAAATLDQLKKDKRTAEAEKFQAAIDRASIRDCEVHVSWTGDAEVDMSVEEPAGSVCSFRTPRTLSGGMMLSSSADRSDAATGEGISADYVVTKGFSGQYHVLLRRVWGKVSGGKVTIDVYSHLGDKTSTRIHKQIPLGEKDAVVNFDLKDGRRQESLTQAQVAAATQNVLGVNQALLQQMAAGDQAPQGVDVGDRGKLAQQLAALNDPAAVQALAASRTVNGVPVNNPVAGNNPLFPFIQQQAVGFQPVITTLPEGTNMSATAVVSADRRYVRISVVPLFSAVGDVTTFNFTTGAQTLNGGAGRPPGGGP